MSAATQRQLSSESRGENQPHLIHGFPSVSQSSISPQSKPPASCFDVSALEYKKRLAADIVKLLERSSDNPVVQAHAERIIRCNSDENLFVGSDLHNADGELFDGRGTLWSCNSRLCPNCVGRLARRSRKVIRAVMQEEKLLLGENWFFITYTLPDLALRELPLPVIAEVMQTAWANFTHCETSKGKSKTWFQSHIRGGFKSCEFTVSAKHETYHYHIHSLCIARRITANNYAEIKHAWTTAVKSAFKHHRIEFECNTEDGFLVVNVEKVRNRERAISELAKYVTKSDSWSKVPPEQLAEVASVTRFWRMFESFGDCRKTARKLKEKAVTERENAKQRQSQIYSDGAETTYLDTKNLKPRQDLSNQNCASLPKPKKSKPWRVRCREIPLDHYKIELSREIEECRTFRQMQLRRKYSFATFQTLSGESF